MSVCYNATSKAKRICSVYRTMLLCTEKGGTVTNNKSVTRTIQILEYLGSRQTPIGISELSRELDIPKSSLSDCLYTLCSQGWIRQTEGGKQFQIDSGAVKFGLMALEKLGLSALVRAEMAALERKCTPGSTAIYVLDGDMCLCSARIQRKQGRYGYTPIGGKEQLHLTAGGKAILAELSTDERVSLIGSGCFPSHTSTSISNDFLLGRELDRIKEQGYATEQYENNNHIWAMAAFFHSEMGQPAAIAMEWEEKPGQLTELVHALLDTVSRIREICMNERKE